ncbi:restriction endonuclease subunit S [Trueperella pyogenes]|uniref:restriction endonuclease subunit S n=1 Tax=Trueperella pyogenes TaxID=1661 RepID=UPI00345D6EA7
MSNKNVPAVRGDGFTQPWVAAQNNDIFTVTNERGFAGLPVLSATQEDGFVPRSLLGKNISYNKESEATYKRVRPGDFAIHLRSFQGGFAHSRYEGITSPAYTTFRFQRPELHDDLYWKHFFASDSFIQQLSKVTYGIRDGRSIGVDEYFNEYSVFPSTVEEQQAIGKLFSSLDELLAAHRAKHRTLQQTKTSLLQRLFPQDGADEPEMRVGGFTGKWSQFDLGSAAGNWGYGLNAAATVYDNVYKYIRITDIDDETRLFNKLALTSPKQRKNIVERYLVGEGDLLFARTGASVGKAYLYRETDENTVFAGFLIRATVCPDFDPEFIFQQTFTDAYWNYVSTASQRSGQPGMNSQEFQKFTFFAPSLEEQQAIGAIFTKLDSLIAAEAEYIAKLTQAKTALLQKMFVSGDMS